jgi:predicted nucleotide-binding protein
MPIEDHDWQVGAIVGRSGSGSAREVFNKIYDYYRDNKLPSPSDKFFKNMVETDFGIPPELTDECIRLLIENGKFANILRELQGSLCVIFSETPPEHEEPQKPDANAGLESQTATPEARSIPTQKDAAPCTPKQTQIFVVHGRNRVPLEQLKKILTVVHVPHKVAVDEPHTGRPISQKVAELMQSCTSAIVIFTSDEEYTDAKGNKVYRPSDNAVYELGAASILYGKNIVILKEEGVTLASDFGDLGYISFEKDKLDAKMMDLITEFIGFGLLKLTPA